MNNISNTTNAAPGTWGSNPWMIVAPAAAVGAFAIGTRAIAGAASLGFEGAKKAADYFEKHDWSETFDDAAKLSMGFAKRNISLELGLAMDLTVIAAVIFAAAQIMPRAEVISNVTNNVTEDILNATNGTFNETLNATKELLNQTNKAV